MRKVDKSKKSNIKCEHCIHYCGEPAEVFDSATGHWYCVPNCELTNKPKNYWNRCKSFEWAEGEKYD